MNEFLSVLSHELRNFLAPLTSALDVQELEQPEAGASQLHGIMRRSTEHLTRLVGDLLDVSRASSGKLTITPQSVRLQEIVGRALEMTQTAMTERSQAVHVDLPRQDIWVQGDPFRLTQVFVNLLHNASKYSPHGKSIFVDLRGEGQDAVLRVRDEGIGIAPEMLPEVFKLFVQAEGGPSRNSGGLGIGLALVSKLIELHGGSVSATSPGVGLGSEFVARLPIAGAANASVGAPEPPRATLQKSAGKRVLIVDDHHDGALALAVYLRTRGHVVEIGHSAEDALVLVDHFLPEIIILDIGLPRVDGYQVARQLRDSAVGAEALLLAVTGFGQEDDREKAQQAGFNHFLVKPVNLDRLSQLVEGPAVNR
jgi:CheY-like chemotaxis protein